MILSVDRLEFGYHSRIVLKDISFALQKGEVFSILGVNGSGKSTLLKCLNKILKPVQGVIMLDNTDLSSLSRTDIACKIGYVTQKYESSRVTVYDAVLLGRKPYIKWGVSEQDLQITDRVLRMLGLESYALRYLNELSGGELQKVVIARAFAQEAQVLLLDEPTSNLDLKNQLEVLQIVRKAAQEQNIAAVVVMHDLNLALRFSDKFLLLKDKMVFAYGGREVITPENILSVYGVEVAVESIHNVPVVIPL